MDHNIIPIFPRPLYLANIGTLESESVSFLRGLPFHEQINGKNFYSDNTNILDTVEMSSLKSRIQTHLDTYVKEVLCTDNEVSLRITQSWVNVNPPGTFHNAHMHTNSIVSGVFYIEPSTLPSMMFHKETPHGIDFVCDSERNMFNSPHFKIKCEAGLLVLFPSDLKHSVETNASEDNRMSLAFNTYISGTIGDKYLLNLLEL